MENKFKTGSISRLVCLLPLLFISAVLYSQDDHEPLNMNIIPPSPNALSLSKFGDIPVGTYTGIPNINIPIYEITGKDFIVPISLKYHAGGIRVDEIASSVGLGWALSAGGAVSRTVRGLADDMATYGYLNAGEITNCGIALYPEEENYLQCDRYYKGRIDAEQDIYSVNVGNLSFKFTLSKEGEPELDPQSKISVKMVQGDIEYDAYGDIVGWEITDENGVQYYFNELELTKSSATPGFYEYHAIKDVVTSWYIDKIVTPFGLEEINFEYEDYTYYYVLPVSESYKPEYVESYSEIRLNGKRISEIRFKNGTINFNYLDYPEGSRCDLVGDHALSDIEVLSLNGDIIKQYEFTYKYMTETGFVDYYSVASGPNELDKRLVLWELLGEGKPPYHFTYNTGLPARESKSQDHWGFYNGKDNPTLLPKTYYKLISMPSISEIGNADRRPDPQFVQSGVLTKIDYPTGGSTTFDYEINQSCNPSLEYELEHKIYAIDGITTSVDIEIKREQLPYTDFTFQLMTSSSCFTEDVCGVKAKIMQGETLLESIDISQWDFENDQATKFIKKVNIPNGTYQFTFEFIRTDLCSCTGDGFDPFLLKLTYYNESADKNKNAGGIRVKKIIDNADPSVPESSIIRTYQYTYDDGSSSGYILHHPVYLNLYDRTNLPSDDFTIAYFFGSLSSASRAYMGNTQGSPVGYARVVEYYGENGENGSIDYSYTSPNDYPDFYGTGTTSFFPHVPPSSFENYRGLLKSKITYNQNHEMINKVTNTYDFSETWDDENITNMKVGAQVFDNDNPVLTTLLYGRSYTNYQLKATLITSRTVDYFPSGESTELQIDYTYDSEYNKLKTRTTSYFSDGDIITEKFYYPQDFQEGISTAIDALYENNIFNQLITKEDWKGPDNDNLKLINSDISVFKDTLGGAVFLDEMYSLYSKNPVDLSEIQEFDPTAIIRNSDYYFRTLKVVKNDDKGNILEYLDENNNRISYFWSYFNQDPLSSYFGNLYPVVEAANVNYSELDAAVYSAASYSGLSPINWIYDPVVQSTTLASFNSKIRELLPDALINTYTYKPGIGMTSQTGPNGVTTYYEYDDYGRLSCVRDDDLHILKTYDYHYQENFFPAPLILIDYTVTQTSISFNWYAVTDASSYTIYRSVNDETMELLAEGVTGTNYTDYAIESNKAYIYYVQAVNDEMTSDFGRTKTIFSLLDTPANVEGPESVCPDDYAIFTVDPVEGATYYEWIIPDNSEFISGEDEQTVTIYFGTNAGDIQVRAMNQNTKSDYYTISVTLSPLPDTPGDITGSSYYIPYTTQTYSISPLLNVISYEWTVEGATFDPTGQGTRSIDVYFEDTGATITVSAINSCGSTSSEPLVVTEGSLPPESITASPTSVDPGQSTTLSVVGGSLVGDDTWEWYSGTCGGTPVGTGETITVSPTTATTYFVRAEGSSLTECVSITININSVPPTSIIGNSSMVNGCGPITLSIEDGSLGTDASWKWYQTGCGSSYVGTGTSITASPAATTTYYVRAEGTANTTDCISKTVTVDPVNFMVGIIPTVPYTGRDNTTMTVDQDGCGELGVESSETWVTITDVSNTAFSYSCVANPLTTTRSAVITLTMDGDTYTINVTQNAAPSLEANFSYSYDINLSRATVQFEDSSTGDPTSWEWDFNNDGITDSSVQNPTHIFFEGSYPVTLTIHKDGVSDSITKTVFIAQNPD